MLFLPNLEFSVFEIIICLFIPPNFSLLALCFLFWFLMLILYELSSSVAPTLQADEYLDIQSCLSVFTCSTLDLILTRMTLPPRNLYHRSTVDVGRCSCQWQALILWTDDVLVRTVDLLNLNLFLTTLQWCWIVKMGNILQQTVLFKSSSHYNQKWIKSMKQFFLIPRLIHFTVTI